jgi:hypothetical protein
MDSKPYRQYTSKDVINSNTHTRASTFHKKTEKKQKRCRSGTSDSDVLVSPVDRTRAYGGKQSTQTSYLVGVPMLPGGPGSYGGSSAGSGYDVKYIYSAVGTCCGSPHSFSPATSYY